MTAALPEWNGAVQPVYRTAKGVRNIVLPVDGTERSRAAVPVARTLARLYSASLHVIYVGEEQLDLNQAANRLRLGVDEADEPVFEQGGSDPVKAVMSLIWQLPDPLAVVSTELGRHTNEDRFGSVTEALFERRPEWAVVVSADHGEAPWNLGQILLAHDGTPASNVATGPAADLAQRSGAEVIALHVAARGEERPEEAGSISAPIYFDQPQHEWPAWAHEFMNRVLAGGTPASSLHFKLTVTGGQPGSEVAQVARDRHVDMVVMAWHGHWDHQNCATRVVVRTSGCPVLLAYAGE